MTRAYNVVDADGHILEPLDLWTTYIDPGFATGRRGWSSGKTGRSSWSSTSKSSATASAASAGSARSARGRASSRPTRWNTRTVSPAASIRISASRTWTRTASTPLPLSSLGCSQARSRPATRRRGVSRLQPLARRLLPALSERLFGVAMLPMQSVDLAIAEMRFAKKSSASRAASSGPTRTTQDDQPPRLRAVLGRRRPRLSIGFHEGGSSGMPTVGSTASRAAAPGISCRTRWR